jgi:hypothetical protein
VKGKIFTISEARQTLPLISRIGNDILTTYREVTEALKKFETLREGEDDIAIRKTDFLITELLDRFQSYIAELETLGMTSKDFSTEKCTIDIYAELDNNPGEIVYLCYEVGEEDIRYWHPVDRSCDERSLIASLETADSSI